MEKTTKSERYHDYMNVLSVSGLYKKRYKNVSYRRSDILKKIIKAIKNDEFTLFYQPEYDLETGKVIGVEALVRWISPDSNTIIPPDVFIPVAEKTGLIFELDRMVIRKALNQKMIWESNGLGHIELSINLSSKTIESEENFRCIEEIIKSINVDYNTVIFEITETMVITNIDLTMERLNRLREYGIRFALDDFGTGYSSLIHLVKLPIDIIKIDKTFIKSIPNGNEETAITKNILAMAHDLNFKVVAEGIETEKQLEYLQINSCEGGQGFLLCVPLPSDKVVDIIRGSA
ncbi:EAL domain-containing protein (putative c-di-GMP-specific phosphodiesterase class I) [Herbinix hemicellulosilytica]|uniref:EAL domain-containing protein n=1 Tax=Herbinix hemicellulosilytica TaxID=1564487 RepID=A0A0H5SDK1_HERHM|nr:EAL domain-containing protein [Herbinix hemicellulosilytica]RBP55642.1 EAL domain-containing protein (putative c-di-GMP-specific phosphodiesterase class I) [Herbinix hemicellulosilytica]CRZ33484.1 hypothetical protein HHT355_0272 [Herbinix hemicellulosilytica]